MAALTSDPAEVGDDLARLRARIVELEEEHDCILSVIHTAYLWAKCGVGALYDALAELQHHAQRRRGDEVRGEQVRANVPALQGRYRQEMDM